MKGFVRRMLCYYLELGKTIVRERGGVEEKRERKGEGARENDRER